MKADLNNRSKTVFGAVTVILCSLLLSGCFSVSGKLGLGSDLSPVALRCNYLENPKGVDDPAPRLFWRVESRQRGQAQTAYRILVASSAGLLSQGKGDLWDSGKVLSDQTTQVTYSGQALKSRQECFWKVQAWDKAGQPSGWSEPSKWTMALLKAEDWSSQWISYRDTSSLHTNRNALFLPPARYYRKSFSAAKTIQRATIYASALGIYELHLNGRRIGDAFFAPGWSDYRKRAYYNSYDVTSQLRTGSNALGAIVADGWYSGYVGYGLLVGYGPNKVGRYFYGKTPAFLAQLEVEYTDGSRETISTDSTWKVTGGGPIQEADFLMGERYDARQEMPGWDQPGYNDQSWEPAIPAEKNGSTKTTFSDTGGQREVELGFLRPAKLQAYPAQPVRPIAEIRPVALTSPSNGVFIFNLGQNFAGLARLKVKGPAGTQIRLRFGEMLHPDGRLMTENLRRARAQDFYILRGDPKGETYTPHFTFHGFQYVEVTGYPGQPGLDAITGIVLHSDTPLVSDFICSDPMINRLFKNIVWTQRANFLELPTDCPQRDERLGWMGDAQVYVRAATYNADVGAFYTKWLQDLEEAQCPNGAFPDYAPYPMQHGKEFATGWMDAGIICPWTIWKAYGDKKVIEQHWAAMQRFMEFRKKEAKDFLGIEHGNSWGDWLALNEKTPLDFLDTIYFAYTSKLMAEMAEAIGRRQEAADYRQLFENIQSAFAKKYLRNDGSLSVDTQTAYALSLYAGLIPEKLRQQAGERLAQKVRDNDTRMATGFLGTRPLLPVLSSVGQHDLAVRLLQSRKFPSWGYEVENGATTIWERWNSFTKDKGFGDASMNSFAHYSFGAVCEWMFYQLAGIESDGPGFKRLILRPSPPSSGSNPDQKPINWVKAGYGSIHGRVECQWRKDERSFEFQAVIPANVTATLYLPAREAGRIKESGRTLEQTKGLKFLRMEGDRAVLAVQSGKYHFVSEL